MKTLILFGVAVSLLSGCSTAPERIARANEEDARAFREMQAKKELKPGLTLSQVTDVWGKPDKTDFESGTLSYYYQNGEDPVRLIFRNEKLISWKHDDAGAAQAKQINAMYHTNEINRQVAEKKNTCATFPTGFGGFITKCN